MNHKCALVVTTIGDGGFLQKYAEQIKNEGFVDQCEMIVIPDKKTNPQIFERCEQLLKHGFQIKCPTIEEQHSFLKRLGGIVQVIPYNSDNRRNVGFLMALENGCDFIISIDDDNYCRPKDPFFGEHAIVCQGEVQLETLHSSNGWYNICDLMVTEPKNVYPRGFPYYARFQDSKVKLSRDLGKIHLNAGLWLREPDIDAITWLANPAKAVSFHGQSVLLGEHTWSPINTQNTAVHRDAIIAFYFIPMGYPIGGMWIDRYGDIFSGYFCQACVRHLGYRVRVGTPIVDHIRNPHNYLDDLTKELPCILLIEEISSWLREIKLDGNTYVETYLSLADALEGGIDKFSGYIWNDSARSYFHQIIYCMRTWVNAVRTIGGA
jgi:hypothetical protein